MDVGLKTKNNVGRPRYQKNKIHEHEISKSAKRHYAFTWQRRPEWNIAKPPPRLVDGWRPRRSDLGSATQFAPRKLLSWADGEVRVLRSSPKPWEWKRDRHRRLSEAINACQKQTLSARHDTTAIPLTFVVQSRCHSLFVDEWLTLERYEDYVLKINSLHQ